MYEIGMLTLPLDDRHIAMSRSALCEDLGLTEVECASSYVILGCSALRTSVYWLESLEKTGRISDEKEQEIRAKMEVARKCHTVGMKFSSEEKVVVDLIKAVEAGEYVLDSRENEELNKAESQAPGCCRDGINPRTMATRPLAVKGLGRNFSLL